MSYQAHSTLQVLQRRPFYYMVLFGLCCSEHPPFQRDGSFLAAHFLESAGWASGRPVHVGRPSASESSCAVLHAISVPQPWLAPAVFGCRLPTGARSAQRDCTSYLFVRACVIPVGVTPQVKSSLGRCDTSSVLAHRVSSTVVHARQSRGPPLYVGWRAAVVGFL